MRQCGNVGRRAMRCGAPADASRGTGHCGIGHCAGRQRTAALPTLPHCRIAKLPHWHTMAFLTFALYDID